MYFDSLNQKEIKSAATSQNGLTISLFSHSKMAKTFKYYLPSLQLSIEMRVLSGSVLDLKLTDHNSLVVDEYKYRVFPVYSKSVRFDHVRTSEKTILLAFLCIFWAEIISSYCNSALMFLTLLGHWEPTFFLFIKKSIKHLVI